MSVTTYIELRYIVKGKKTTELYEENKCPLCNNDNACLTICSNGVTEENTPIKKACWCMNPDIGFSDNLLKKVPSDAKNKSCICQACALAHQVTKVSIMTTDLMLKNERK